MKRKLIALCVSSVLVGSGIIFNMNQDVSIPTVEKFTEDTSTSVSKHETTVSEYENVDKDEKTSTGDTIKKTESKEEKQKEKLTSKSESKTTSVSSEGKKQNYKKESSTKRSSGSDQKASTSNSSNTSDKSNTDVVSQPVEKPSESKQEPVVEPTPTPEPARPSYACPGGVNPDVSCDVILDTNFYFATYGSQAEADAAGMYYLDEVMYIGDIEITNYSVQPVYRNDHSIAYYGLNLWSNGNLIQ
ncbi:hypothetical protein [uncultured Holdemanella sp.]|uniref:hypothetical protein n=1 Tax=uncultured Holdemanella sp. TaxID=1763549 RepID=UPI0026000AE5|nr:hypothetical protein [uncultured Holdemanella sp.]